ncbi:restriction endonuclease subunit S [Pseudomonas sp. B21-036]|uniref:restriction endonuclease subunit S n=1 Tax=unclassified Pseudomonas TaxID=196821 RepID=UPI0021607F3C|nr:restriction endonuclease subunit S [Pseudomonas sp. B21-036]UVL50629.1 restriction endonuclease subunit S [Pseudomonas sp. B21-036]
MSSEWYRGKLGDVVELKRGYDLPQAQRTKGSVPLVSSSGVSDFHNTAMVKGPGVVTGRYGTIGKVFYVEDDFWPLNTTLYVRDFKGNDPKFIHYFLRSVDFFAYSDKAAVPGVNRNHLHEAAVHIPGVCEQKEIAGLLGALDDRIILLRETNATLEAIARALFKSWFVDFDPVRAKSEGLDPDGMDAATAALFPDSFVDSELGLIPRGWATRPIYDMASYINGAAYKTFEPNAERRGLPIIKIAELKAGVTLQTAFSDVTMPEKYLIRTGDILFSWSGNPDTSIDTFVWGHDPALLNQHIFRVLPHVQSERSFVLQALRNLKPVFAELARNKQTTGLGHVTVADLKRLCVVNPPGMVIEQFNSLVEKIHQMIFGNEQKAKTLTQLRDTLLPRLISGQLRLPEVEASVKAVLSEAV